MEQDALGPESGDPTSGQAIERGVLLPGPMCPELTSLTSASCRWPVAFVSLSGGQSSTGFRTSTALQKSSDPPAGGGGQA